METNASGCSPSGYFQDYPKITQILQQFISNITENELNSWKVERLAQYFKSFRMSWLKYIPISGRLKKILVIFLKISSMAWKFETFAQYFYPLGFHAIKSFPLIKTLRAFRIS
mgnify:FL=1